MPKSIIVEAYRESNGKRVRLSRRNQGSSGRGAFRPLHCNELILRSGSVSIDDVRSVSDITFQMASPGEDPPTYRFAVLDMVAEGSTRKVFYVLWEENNRGGSLVPITGAGTLTVVVETTGNQGQASGSDADTELVGP